MSYDIEQQWFVEENTGSFEQGEAFGYHRAKQEAINRFPAAKLLFVILLASFADAYCTWYGYARGVYEETNTLMDSFLSHGMWWFFGGKMGLTILGVLLLYWFRRLRFARYTTTFLLGVYVVILWLHFNYLQHAVH